MELESRPDEQLLFRVVVNDEEQYSIWPYESNIPRGWYDVDVRGSQEECLSYIEKTWTDIRPLRAVPERS